MTDLNGLIKKFNDNHPDKKIIFLVQAGSHFFNLNSPNSDTDYRGIYMPSPETFYNGESKRKMIEYKTNAGNKLNVKNSSSDIDFTLFSITKFLELLKSGDFNCMELLHTPADKIIIDSDVMKELRGIRQSILVNNISAFLGFIKKEYKRYGVNVHHYAEQENLMNFLKKYPKHSRLKDIWKEVHEYAKDNPYITFSMSDTGNNHYVPSVKIAQRLYHYTVRIDYIIEAIEKRLKTYGHRQRNMAKSGVEFKGLYHALRLIYEANDLFDHGEFKLPFDKDRHAILKSIKESTVEQDYIFNLIDNEIEKLYDREKTVASNKKQVGHLIDKIKYNLVARKKIEHLWNRKIS